ncbi:TIGR02281 family clan AA aspartic protease [Azoarcus sp. L1K30]|uniref:retropepsin-like aspartic protease family protein n=1 Tax=Azoarcus sp. L1K30 TaxID=2820277 RepID=UPI001B80F5FB|nr:TIGR02281 family clan AA aspartic protease [Azoarcus sp. L1K30]MBR0567532.1 TIGR02281 family clan AA aspartic protease [Azoarcus sp. L1K30]
MQAPEQHDTRRLGRIMSWLAAFALLGVLWLFFADQVERRLNPNRNVEIVPGSGELVLQRNRMGHYIAPGTINGQPVSFLLDTGATQVSIPARLGPVLELQPGSPAQVSTANGNITVRMTVIDELVLGPFVVRQIRANLNPGMTDEQILLGMNVLRHLEFVQRGDTLILRAPR